MSSTAPRRRRLADGIHHGRLRKQRAISTIVRFVAAAVAVLLVSGAAVAAIATWDVAGSIKPGIPLGTGTKTTPVKIDAIKGGVNLLLVGTDTRTGQGGDYGTLDDSAGVGNNDVTMLLHIAENHKSATVVSFPRDLMIPIPACPNGKGGFYSAISKQQFNSTLLYGGLNCTVLTVEQLTGLKIPFAGLIKFKGVIAMSNAIGGVQVCVASRIDDDRVDPPLHLAPGKYTLKGGLALSFLRTRHGLNTGSDLARISNQQVYLSALVRKIEAGGVLNNPLTLYPLAKAAASNIFLSQSLTDPKTLVQIGLALKNIDFDKVLFLQYPVVTDPQNTNRVVPDAAAAHTLFAALQADQTLKISGSVGSGSVVTTPPPTAPGSSPAPTSTAAPTTPPGSTVVLPDNVHGQTAAEQTCSKGSG